jgi:hypothetical protein
VALLFGCLIKFGYFVILQTPPEDFKNFVRGFASGTDNENAVEFLFVRAVACRKSDLDILACSSNFLLFLA